MQTTQFSDNLTSDFDHNSDADSDSESESKSVRSDFSSIVEPNSWDAATILAGHLGVNYHVLHDKIVQYELQQEKKEETEATFRWQYWSWRSTEMNHSSVELWSWKICRQSCKTLFRSHTLSEKIEIVWERKHNNQLGEWFCESSTTLSSHGVWCY